MRAKVIAVLFIVLFYIFVIVGVTWGFPELASTESAKWYEVVAFLVMYYGFIFCVVSCAYHSIKWVLKK